MFANVTIVLLISLSAGIFATIHHFGWMMSIVPKFRSSSTIKDPTDHGSTSVDTLGHPRRL